MGLEQSKLFQRKKCSLQYQYEGYDLSIEYDPSLHVNYQKSLRYNVIASLAPTLKDLDEDILKQLQFHHEIVLKKTIFEKNINEDELMFLYQATKYLFICTKEECLQILKDYNLLNFVTKKQQSDLDKQILILIIIHYLIGKIPELTLEADHIEWLLKHLNPYNAINVSLIVQIFTDICLQKDEAIENIFQILKSLKEQAKFRFDTEPLFKILEVQQNIYILANMCTFINELIQIHSNDDIQQLIKQQFNQYGMSVILDDLKIKLKNNEFQIQACTLDYAFQFLNEQKNLPHYSQVDNYYFNNLMYFDPKRPLIFNYGYLDNTFNSDVEQFENAKGILSAQLEAYETLNKQESTFNQTIIEKQALLTMSAYTKKSSEGIVEALKGLWQNKTSESTQQQLILNQLRKAQNLEDVQDTLQKFHEQCQGVTITSRLVETLTKKIDQIQKDLLKKEQMRKDREDGYKQQIIYLQQEIKQRSQNESQRDIKNLNDKLAQMIEENARLQEQSQQYYNLKNKYSDMSKQLTDVQAVMVKAQQVAELEAKLEEYANEINRLKTTHTQPQLMKIQPPEGGSEPPPNPSENTAQVIVQQNIPVAPLPPPPPPAPKITTTTNVPPPPPPPLAPPAPKIGNNIAAPPPPPLPGGKVTVGAPPPPPINLKPAQPTKPKCKPSVPMKGLSWNILKPDQIGNTIFQGMNEKEIKFNIANLEEKFASKPAKKIDNVIQSVEDKKKISLLSSERVKNVELILGKLKMSNEKIKIALLQCDKTVLTLGVVESLLNAVPNEQERSLYANPDELDRDTLQIPDIFFIEICAIPSPEDRLQAIKAEFTTLDQCSEAKEKLQKLKEGLMFQKKDEALKILIKCTLAIGNYVNGESARGGAFGFKLDAISKAADVKSLDGKETLLMTIVQECEQIQEQKFSGSFYTTLHQETMEFMSRLPLSQMMVDINEIKKAQKFVQNAVKSKSNNQLDKVNRLEELIQLIQQQITDLSSEYLNCEQLYTEVCSFYCENPKTMQSDVFFQQIQLIWNCYDKAKQQIIKVSQLKLKEEQRNKLDQQKKQPMSESIPIKTNTMSILQQPKAEDVIEQLNKIRLSKNDSNN